jgi:UDP:flavonoid glycosyltransferase YjiC (YdhE family)
VVAETTFLGTWPVLLGGVQRHLAQLLRDLGAPMPAPFILDGMVTMPDRYLQLSIRSLEYPRSDEPVTLRFIGALPTGVREAAPLPAWWGEVTSAERPVVAVSQGTVANRDLTELMEPALAALADLDVLVVATPGREAPLRLVPGNARVAPFIPFDDLLPHVSVLVSNGGYGGVQQALRHGVPMVLAGLTEDKAEVTARTAWTGAAVDLATQRPEPADLRKAVEQVLTDPGCAARARGLAAEYERHDPFTAIAETVTELLRPR